MEDFFKQLLRAIAVALGMAYVVAGAMIMYMGALLGLDKGLRITFGILLIIYGIYRTIRAARKTVRD